MITQQTTPDVAPPVMILVLATWAATTIAATMLVRKHKMNAAKNVAILSIAVAVAGFILGAVPNPLLPVNQVLLAIAGQIPLAGVVPMVAILAMLLGSTFLVGRAFCGHACPLGALQELVSRARFTSSVKENKRHRTVNVSPRVAAATRAIVLGAMIVPTVAWGIAVIQLANPFLGFRVFQQPLLPALLVPVVLLAATAVASVVMYRPWCRLACPFGAIASATSRASVLKLRRTSACTSCGICEKTCPTGEAGLAASKAECYLCNRCIESCPANAIILARKTKKEVD